MIRRCCNAMQVSTLCSLAAPVNGVCAHHPVIGGTLGTAADAEIGNSHGSGPHKPAELLTAVLTHDYEQKVGAASGESATSCRE